MERAQMSSRTSHLRESVQCPICLELLTSPRALVCLHTFCEDCIQGVVDGIASSSPSVKSLPCPVCREQTPPPKRGLPPGEWAKHLRKNVVILPLIESLNTVAANSGRQLPSVLEDTQHSSTTHVRSPAPSSNRVGEPSTKTETCSKHPTLQVTYYCRDHAEVLCKRCKTTHTNCMDVAVLKSNEMKLDVEWSKQDIGTAFQRSLGEITGIIEALQVNSRNTATEIEHFPRRVRELQAILNRNIDTLCETLERNTETSKDEHTKLQIIQIADCRRLEENIQLYKSELNFILRNRGLFQQFLACENIKSQIVDFDNAVASAKKSMQFCKVRVTAVQVLESLIRLQDDLPKIESRQYKPDFID